jgi:hypothetical protein
MAFSEEVAIKYGAFTLACQKLLEHFDSLDRALRGDTRGQRDRIIANVDRALQEGVYQAKSRDLIESVAILAPALEAERRRLATLSPPAAEVIAQVAAEIERAAPTWRYREAVAACQAQGRDLARLFYTQSPWLISPERLGQEVGLVFAYGSPREDDYQAFGQETYSHKVAPMAYRSNYEEDEETWQNVIVVRFYPDHNFTTYCAYPFFFLHEYVSHIYGANSQSQAFDDGWMFYAIHVFVEESTSVEPLTPPALWPMQLRAVSHYFPGRISSSFLQDHYHRAQRLHVWLRRQHPSLFQRLTWELAAHPRTGRGRESFHARFVEALGYEFENNRSRLQYLLSSFSGVDDLLAKLSPL